MENYRFKEELESCIYNNYGFSISEKVGRNIYYRNRRGLLSCGGFSWFTSRKIKRILFESRTSGKIINILGNMCLLISMLAWVAMLDTSHGTYKWPSMDALNRLYSWSLFGFIILFAVKIFLENRNFRCIREKLFRMHENQ